MRWLDIQDLHSRMIEVAVKRPWGDPTATFKRKQREDEALLLEAESQSTSATDQLQQRVVKHWSRLLRDAVERKIFPKYNPNWPQLASILSLHWVRGWTKVPQEVPSNQNHFTTLWHYIKWRIYLNFKHKTLRLFSIYAVIIMMLLGLRFTGLSTHFHTRCRGPATPAKLSNTAQFFSKWTDVL